MVRSQKIAGALMTVLSGAVVYAFFAFKYPYHLHFQEQYQLFESTWDYFISVVAVPGGLADWIGRFLTQFSYYAPAGAVVMAILFCSIQLLTWSVCSRKTLTVYALSFVPAIAALAFYCDESALAGGAVAIILSLAMAALTGLIHKVFTRRLLKAVFVPAIYLACGPLAIVYVLIAIIDELRRKAARCVPFAVCMVVLAAICPLVAAWIFPYPLKRLVLGVHYYRYHNILPGMLWVSALCAVLASAFAALRLVGRCRCRFNGIAELASENDAWA